MQVFDYRISLCNQSTIDSYLNNETSCAIQFEKYGSSILTYITIRQQQQQQQQKLKKILEI
jgi:hypothetical protein